MSLLLRKKFVIYFAVLAVLFGVYYYRETHPDYLSVGGQVVAGEKINNIEDSTQIFFLDVGQGDAGLIVFPNGKKMLIDCGANAIILEALGRVLEFGDRHIDYLLISHPDLDHYGGCVDVLDRFDVDNFIYNGVKKSSDKYFREFWSALENERVIMSIIDHEDVWGVANVNLHFLFPDKPLSESLDDTNSGSIVFRLSYGQSDILFMGDAPVEVEKHLLDKYRNLLNSKILKVGHHGSTSASDEHFLREVSPEYAVISVGVNNRYGHPSERVLKRLQRVSSTIFQTGIGGDVKFDLASTTVNYID